MRIFIFRPHKLNCACEKVKCACDKAMKKTIAFEYEFSFSLHPETVRECLTWGWRGYSDLVWTGCAAWAWKPLPIFLRMILAEKGTYFLEIFSNYRPIFTLFLSVCMGNTHKFLKNKPMFRDIFCRKWDPCLGIFCESGTSPYVLICECPQATPTSSRSI